MRLALEHLAKSLYLVISMPNADTMGSIFRNEIENLKRDLPYNVSCIENFGKENYFSAMTYAKILIGNTSSGILEVPTFKKATINIGNRQLGREMAESVINCELESSSIAKSIDKIYSKNFKEVLSEVSNPYGSGGASSKIFGEIKKSDLSNLVIKRFHDL